MMRRIGSLGDFALVVLLLLAACVPARTTFAPTLSPTLAWTPTVVVTALPTSTATAEPTSPAPSPTALAPSPTLEPSLATTQPGATPTTPPRSITLEEPRSGAEVSSPVHVRGKVSVTPFESTLSGRVYDASGQVIGAAPIMLPSEMGQPGTFDGYIPFNVTSSGTGRVEVAEVSPKDGAVVISAQVEVLLVPAAGAGAIEIPAAGAVSTLPLHILAHVGQPDEAVVATLRWQDGTELTQTFTALRASDGRGLLVNSLNWPGESQPPEPPTQEAILELRDLNGAVLAQQQLTILSPSDPDTGVVKLYFVLGETLQSLQQRVPKTVKIGTAALEELLWGPPPPNLAGFTTAIPAPQEVLSFPGREPDWGPRVTLLSLTIVNGVATADFSQEMKAYGGGSLRVMLLRQQIVQTLKQFPTVQEVLIAVEGETEGVLEP